MPEYAGTALRSSAWAASAPTADVGRHARRRSSSARGRASRHGARRRPRRRTPTPSSSPRRPPSGYGLQRLSDLAAVAPRPDLRRPAGVPDPPAVPRRACERATGCSSSTCSPSTPAGRDPPGAASRRHVDVGAAVHHRPGARRPATWSSLVDDRGLQPAENVTPLVRTEVRRPLGRRRRRPPLDAVSARLTTDVAAAARTRPQPPASTPPRSPPRGSREQGLRMTGERTTEAADRPERAGTAGAAGAADRRRAERPPPPADRRAAAAAAQHRHAPARAARRRSPSCSSGSVVVARSAPGRRVTDRVDAALLRQIARLRTPWLTDVCRRDRPRRLRLDGRRVVALRADRRADRPPALAPPVHVPRQRARARARSARRPVRRLRPARARTTSRSSAAGRGFSMPSPPVAVADHRRSSAIVYTLVVPGRPRDDRQGRSPPSLVAVFVVRPAVPRRRPPVRRRSSASRSASRSRSTRSASSPRTRSSRSPTGGARPRTSTSAARGARRSAQAVRGPARADGRSTSSRSASPARAARRRCGSASPATPTRTCSASSTR